VLEGPLLWTPREVSLGGAWMQWGGGSCSEAQKGTEGWGRGMGSLVTLRDLWNWEGVTDLQALRRRKLSRA
jgi:hypothetical protein